jgi:hypothetical protein
MIMGIVHRESQRNRKSNQKMVEQMMSKKRREITEDYSECNQ